MKLLSSLHVSTARPGTVCAGVLGAGVRWVPPSSVPPASVPHTGNVALHRSAVEAGLTMLEAGGDVADGGMAHKVRWLGGNVFVSFDLRDTSLLGQQGLEALDAHGEDTQAT